jgi:hypothetical protein
LAIGFTSETQFGIALEACAALTDGAGEGDELVFRERELLDGHTDSGVTGSDATSIAHSPEKSG